jgi:hypothetical protein
MDHNVEFSLPATSGTNILSPGGAFLGPGPDPDIEDDSLTLTFEPPVRAFGFDHLSQQADGLGYTRVCVIGVEGQELLCSTIDISYAAPDPDRWPGEQGFGKTHFWGTPGSAADFWGVVSAAADIRAVIITEHDDNDQNPDCNIGFDSLRYAPGPRRSDWDQDGVTDSRDALAFLTEFLAGDADFDGSGTTDTSDLHAFLNALFSGE